MAELRWLVVVFILLGVLLIIIEVLLIMGKMVPLVSDILGVLGTVVRLTVRFVVEGITVAVISFVALLISLI